MDILKTNKIIYISLLMLLLSILSVNPVYAKYKYESEHEIGLGDVLISLDEFELDAEGNEIPFKNNKMIVSGQILDKIVKITNKSNPVWIRVKLDLLSSGPIANEPENYIDTPTTNWIKKDQYYYYKKVVNNGESVVFSRKLTIPAEWNSSMSNVSFDVKVNAEAIQATNFTPNFESDSPWFNEEIKNNESDNSGKYDTENKTEFDLIFKGGSEQFIASDKFFNNLGYLLPGDVISDTLTLKNEYYESVDIFFSIDNIENTRLLEKLNLKIESNGQILYDGNLKNGVQRLRIAHIKKNNQKNIIYTVTVPAELNNEYLQEKSKVLFTFDCNIYKPAIRPDEKPGPNGGGGHKNPEEGEIGPGIPINPDITDPTNPDEDKNPTNPSTPDESNPDPNNGKDENGNPIIPVDPNGNKDTNDKDTSDGTDNNNKDDSNKPGGKNPFPKTGDEYSNIINISVWLVSLILIIIIIKKIKSDDKKKEEKRSRKKNDNTSR